MVARYLVTGANGFIGRVVCAHLQAQGAEVVALLRRPVPGPWQTAVLGDLTQALDMTGWPRLSGVVHLAGVAHQQADWAYYQRVNVAATARLVQACVAAEVPRLVYISSVKAMGETTPVTGVDETAPCQPSTPYGQSKYAAEQHILQSRLTEAVVLRLPLVYGPQVKGNLARLLRWTQAGWLPPLPETGNRRSLVHVQDVAEAVSRALIQPAITGQVYLIAEPRAYSAGELGALLRQAVGRAPARWPSPAWAWWLAARAGDGLRRLGVPAPLDSALYQRLFDSACYHPVKAERALGFRASHELATGLRALAGRL